MPRRLLAFLLELALALAIAPATGTARPSADVAAPPSLRQLAKGIVSAGSPGALVFVHDAKGTRAGAAGYANLRTKERMRADHAFRVGSITKTFVAAVVLQLAAEGVLRLDDSVERWLPGLVPNGQAITLRHLLSHTSGIYNYTDDGDLVRSLARNRLAVVMPATLVAAATSHRPLFPPGTAWSYSNTGYILLGLVIETVTATPLEQQLRGRIFEPLGLTRTSFPAAPTLPPPFAHGYLPPGNGLIATPRGKPVDITVWSPSWAWAAGALVSTAGDLARFYRALLTGKLLRPEQLREMKTTVPIESGPEAYGLGLLSIPTPRCGSAWGHDGSGPGYTTLAFGSEDGSYQTVVLVNTTPGSDRLAVRLGNAFRSSFCR